MCLIHWVRTVYFLFTPKDVYNEIMLQNRKFRFPLSYELLKSRLKLIIISSSSCCKGKAVMSFLQTTVKKNKHTSYIILRQHMIWIVHEIIIAKSRHFWSVCGDSSFGQFYALQKAKPEERRYQPNCGSLWCFLGLVKLHTKQKPLHRNYMVPKYREAHQRKFPASENWLAFKSFWITRDPPKWLYHSE